MESTIPSTALATVVNLEAGRLPTSISDAPVIGPGGAKMLWWRSTLIGGGTNTAVDTGYDLPARVIVHDALVEVITAEVTGTTKTLDVGLLASESGGDTDGFIDGVSLAATGIIRPGAAVSGTSPNIILASNTRGVLLSDFDAGTNADDRGLYREKVHIGNGTAKSVVYARGSTLTEFQGYIWLLLTYFPATYL